MSTVFVSAVVAATPNTRPKIETVPSSMPKTTSPDEARKDFFSRRKTDVAPMPKPRNRKFDWPRTIRPTSPPG